MTYSETLIPLAKITGTHGIKGFLKLRAFSETVGNLKVGGTVILRSKDGVMNRLKVENVVNHTAKAMIKFEGLDNINQIESFVNSEICLLRSQLPELGEDEYYWCDLIGLSVATTEGIELGLIENIFEAGSSDIYVVRSAEREYLIPAIADFIDTVDIKNGRMLVSPPEGLLDL